LERGEATYVRRYCIHHCQAARKLSFEKKVREETGKRGKKERGNGKNLVSNGMRDSL
jgi:hypothetical protein